jgi:hypothetical protein
MIKKRNARNSDSKRNNKKEENKKHPTKKSNENTGCLESTTINALKIKKKDNSKNNVLGFIND